MKISVCGKGGSGKSTVVTLLANGMRERGYKPLVVDSDESNSGLYQMLGFDKPPVPLMELVGGKKIVLKQMVSRYSSGESEPEMNVLTRDEVFIQDIPPQHILEKDNIRLVGIGKILHSLEGCACPMGVLSREFLKKLRLKEDEVAIVDMEAGIEHFGRGVETSIDSVLVVVEPSLESITLAEKVKHLASGVGINRIWAVLNKANSEDLTSKLKNELAGRGIAVMGSIPYDSEIFEACLDGRPLGEGGAAREAGKILDALFPNQN